jgi:hypothetical protein
MCVCARERARAQAQLLLRFCFSLSLSLSLSLCARASASVGARVLVCWSEHSYSSVAPQTKGYVMMCVCVCVCLCVCVRARERERDACVGVDVRECVTAARPRSRNGMLFACMYPPPHLDMYPPPHRRAASQSKRYVIGLGCAELCRIEDRNKRNQGSPCTCALGRVRNQRARFFFLFFSNVIAPTHTLISRGMEY